MNVKYITYLLDSDAVENGPRDLLAVEEDENGLVLSFKSDRGVYYSMGCLDRTCVCSYRLDKIASINEVNRKIFQRRCMKQKIKDETNNKILVQPVDPSMRINKFDLWSKMNCLNGLRSVSVAYDGRHAILSYATTASMYYAVGYFEGDKFYNVQTTMPDTDLKPCFAHIKGVEDWGKEKCSSNN